MRTNVLLLTYYGCALYGIVNPVFGLLFFIHITIFRPEALVWGDPAFGRLHMITCLIILIAYFIRKSNNQDDTSRSYQNKNLVVFLYFVIWLLVVTALAQSSVQLSYVQAVEIIKIFAFCFLFVKLINKVKHIELYVWVTSLSFGLLSFWGILQGLAGNGRLDTLHPGGSNYIAVQLAMMSPFVLAKVLDTVLSWKCRLVFLACTISIVLCCMYTNSRGGFMGLSVGMFFFLAKIKQRMRVLAGLAVIIALIYPWMPDSFSERIGSVFAEKQEQDTSAASRTVLWQIALRIWQDHPIAGVGLDNFSDVKETYLDKVRDIVTSEEMFRLIFHRKRLTHGLYTGMMAETGLIGIGLFLTLLFRGIFCRFSVLQTSHPHLYLQAKGAQAGLIGFAVAALFGDFQYLDAFYWQIFFVGAVRGCADSLVIHADTKQPTGLVSLQKFENQ